MLQPLVLIRGLDLKEPVYRHGDRNGCAALFHESGQIAAGILQILLLIANLRKQAIGVLCVTLLEIPDGCL